MLISTTAPPGKKTPNGGSNAKSLLVNESRNLLLQGKALNLAALTNSEFLFLGAL